MTKILQKSENICMKYLISLVFLFIVTLLFNSPLPSLFWGWQNVGQVSHNYPLLVTPPGYIFSIWALIYASLAGAFVISFLYGKKEKKLFKELSRPLAINFACNILWIITWVHEYFILSLISMAGIWTTLFFVSNKVFALQPKRKKPSESLKTWSFAINIYFAWISLASLINITQYISLYNPVGYTPIFSGVILVIASVWTIFQVVQYKRYVFLGVTLWAFIGLLTKFYSTQIELFIATSVLIFIMITAIILLRKKR